MSRNQKNLLRAVFSLIVFIVGVIQVNTSKNQAEIQTTASQGQIAAVGETLRAIDGDTVQETDASTGKKITVRLIGVNTPETVDPRRPVQCFGKEASSFTKKKVAEITDGSYRIEYDESQGKLDKYGRTLAYIYLGTSTVSLNQEIIEQGYGHEYTYQIPYKYQKAFKESERLARMEKRGLWADGVCYTTSHVRNP